MIRRKASLSTESEAFGSPDDTKPRKKQGSCLVGVLVIGGFLFLLANNFDRIVSDSQSVHSLPPTAVENSESCVITSPKLPSKWSTEPLWMPSIAAGVDANGPDDYSKTLFGLLTGLKSGSKNYHAFGKGFRRCHGTDQAITCATSHPSVSVGVHLTNFDRRVLVGLRNFPMAFYASASFKNNKYHDIKGCTKVNDWRKVRDEWYQSAWEDWKRLILTWNEELPNKHGYRVALYLIHEHMVDPVKGPPLVRRLTSVLKEAGFKTISDKEIPCAWFRGMRSHLEYEKSYFDYKPEFTQKQLDFIVKEMTALMEEQSGDLKEILSEYLAELRTWPVDQEPAVVA